MQVYILGRLDGAVRPCGMVLYISVEKLITDKVTKCLLG